MHGIVFKSFEGFVRSSYGAERWRLAAMRLDLTFDSFEPMFHYDDALAEGLVETYSTLLGKSRESLLEDFGTYLIAGLKSGRVRRILRYGGIDYEDFLHSLDDLPGRVGLAVPDIDLPELVLREVTPGRYELACRGAIRGVGHLLSGLLRALADDYGALVVLDHAYLRDGVELVDIHLLEPAFAEGRRFDLAEALPAVGGSVR